MSAHLVSALLMRATRAHMRAVTEGWGDPTYWAGARDALLDAAGQVVGHSRAELRAHVEALAHTFMGRSMDEAFDELRGAERVALDHVICA